MAVGGACCPRPVAPVARFAALTITVMSLVEWK